MWHNYFDGQCTIIGIDIHDKSAIQAKFRASGIDNVHCVLGDQGDPAFWDGFLRWLKDGPGHTMAQQRLTLDKVWPELKQHGVFACEDLCTSYWPRYGGGAKAAKQGETMMAKLKAVADDINADQANHRMSDCGPVTRNFPDAHSVHFYEGICFIRKEPYRPNLAMRR